MAQGMNLYVSLNLMFLFISTEDDIAHVSKSSRLSILGEQCFFWVWHKSCAELYFCFKELLVHVSFGLSSPVWLTEQQKLHTRSFKRREYVWGHCHVMSGWKFSRKTA